jgi:hypothetical protein
MWSARRLLRIWLPTVLGSSMLVVEIPLVYAAVARSDDGARALAALGICFGILTIVNTPALALTPLVVIEGDNQPVRRLFRYTLAVGVLGALVMVVLGGIPHLAPLLTTVVDGDPRLVGDVRAGVLAMVPNCLAVAVRRYLHGRLIRAGRTGSIGVAAMARIFGSGALAWLAVLVVPLGGVIIGGLALSAGAAIEAAMLAQVVRGLPRQGVRGQHGNGRLIGRHAQLSSARLPVQVPLLLTTVVVAHSAEGPLSLIVWPALYQLTQLLAAPTVDWESVVAAALCHDPSNRHPRRITELAAAVLAGIFTVLLVSGLCWAYLRDMVNVPHDAAALGLRWSPLLLAVPALWMVRAYLRGKAMALDATAWLVPASVAHVVVLVPFVFAAPFTTLPGVANGGLAVAVGIAVEVGILGFAVGTGVRPSRTLRLETESRR